MTTELETKEWKDKDRDLRIDFLRGIVMFILVVVHLEFFSFYNFLVWERFGVFSGGEGFVILSGFVIGMVYRPKIIKSWKDSVLSLFDRSFQLYKVNIFIIISIFLLNYTKLFDFKFVMNFIEHSTGKFFSLYPDKIDNFMYFIYQILTLKIGPHQTQILGLYIFLLIFSPIALFFFHNKRHFMFLALSWAIYFINYASINRLTGCQFEYAFPLLTWQLIYFHGMFFGFYKEEMSNIFKKNKKIILNISFIMFFLFMFFAQNTTNPTIPSFAKLNIIPDYIFNDIYKKYFMKNTLGILRILNYFFVLILAFFFLDKYWKTINKYFGWFFIPIGQATLYVFIVHVYLIMLISNFIPFGFKEINYINNTIAHSIALLTLWLMVRNKVLFPWIPR